VAVDLHFLYFRLRGDTFRDLSYENSNGSLSMMSNPSRREFLVLGAGAALAANLPEAAAAPFSRSVVEANDEAVASGINVQALSESHPFCGGIPDARELYLAGTSGRFVQRATAAYFCESSRYFRDESLVERIRDALSFLSKGQTSDGNIALLTTNFNSPPDTGFVVHNVASAANIARIHGADDIARLFTPFLTRAGDGMAKGGIHTPNHRWVVSAALAQINELYPNERYVKRIEAWLAEGIDIDEEGQFTERSTGGYNAVCDNAFVVMACKLKKPELLEPVRKNLDAMAWLLHPNGEVVTEFSNRQDRDTQATMARYWFALRYMAITDGNGLYSSMVKPHEPQTMELPLLMEYPELNAPLPVGAPIPDDYVLDLPRSGVTRIRRGNFSTTIAHRRNSRWISVHHGEAAIEGIRFASSFFGKGQFRPSKFERDGDTLRFSQSLEGRYYQPISDPGELPVSQAQYGRKKMRREVSEVCTLQYEGVVRETERGIAVEIRATGTAGVPLAVEINLGADAQLSGTESMGDDCHLLREGMATCTVGSDAIRFGPGIAEHRYVQIRGAEEKLSGSSVYLTTYTPFETTLHIEPA